MSEKMQIDPLAAVSHYKFVSDTMAQRCLMLEQIVLGQEQKISDLEACVKHRDDEIARLDGKLDQNKKPGSKDPIQLPQT